MELGIVTDSLAHLPFEEMLDAVAGLGITSIELPTGGWSSAPHLDLAGLTSDAAARDRFTGAIAERGLRISALNINGNQLHPVINERITAVNGLLDTQGVERAADRAWNYVTLGLGRPGGRQFWGRFLADLRAAGYDGVLSIEHEDVLLDAVKGVAATVALLREVMPVAPASWKPQDI